MEDAGVVYLLMKDKHRVSRNAKAAWYLEHLNTAIKWPVDSQVCRAIYLPCIVLLIAENLGTDKHINQ